MRTMTLHLTLYMMTQFIFFYKFGVVYFKLLMINSLTKYQEGYASMSVIFQGYDFHKNGTYI